MNRLPDSRVHYLVSVGALVAARSLTTAGGFAVVVLLAAMFGATAETDAYFIARLIPVTLIAPLAVAYNLAFIPLYTESRAEQGGAHAARLAGDFLKVTLFASAVSALLYVVCADWIVKALAPGFPPLAHESAVWMTRVMAVAFVFLGLHSVFDSVLNADHRFVVSAVSSLWVPGGALLGVLFLTESWGIKGVAVGIAGGFVLQALTLAPMMNRYFAVRGWRVDLQDQRFRQAFMSLGLTMLIIALAQMQMAVDRLFASLLDEGAVTALSLGVTFIGVVPFLVALPIFKVMYPVMVDLVERGRNSELRRFFSDNLLVIAFVTLPIAAGVCLFSGRFTDLLFRYGQFSAAAAAQTAEVIFYMAMTLPATVATILLLYYFVLTRRWAPVIQVLCITLVLTAVLEWVLLQRMGVGGIALANALTSVVRLGGLVVVAGHLLGGSIVARLGTPLTKVALSTALAGGAMAGGARLIGAFTQPERLGAQIGVLAFGILLGGLVHLAANRVLRNDELWGMFLGSRPTGATT